MERFKQRPSMGTIFGLAALVVALAGTAIAAPLAIKSAFSKAEKKQVKKIATKQINTLAPGLSVAHAGSANAATNAENAGSADTADSVGGVSIEPVRIALPEGASETPVVSVDGSQVSVSNCGSGQVTLRVARAFGGGVSPPITAEWIVPGAATTNLIANGNALSNNAAVIGFSASIRQSSGRVTRVFIDAFYDANAFGGPDDCFAQGTIERFG